MALAKRFLLISVLLFGASYAHATACSGSATCVQYASTTGLGGSGTFTSLTTSIAFGSNNTAGNTLIAVIGLGGNLAAQATVADTQSNTWAIVGCENINVTPYVGSCIAYAPNCKAGANTVTVTETGGSSTSLVQVVTVTEYAGYLTSVPYDASNITSKATSPAPAVAINTAGASELLISYGFSDYNNTGTWGVTSGFNLVNTINGGTYFQLGMWEEAGVAAGNWSNTITNSGTNRSLHVGIAAFRSVLPTVAHMQGVASNALASTTIAATLPFNVSSGDLLVVAMSATSSTGTVSISGCSATWYKAALFNTSGDIWYAMNNSSGACTATVTLGNTNNVSMALDEYRGLSHTFAVENYSAVTGTANPVNNSLPTSGTSDLIYTAVSSFTVNYTPTGPSSQMTPSSGFGQRTQSFFAGGNPGVTVFDETAAAGTQTNNVTVSNILGGSTLGGTIIAFRSVIPTVGSVQWNACTVALTVNTTCPLRQGIKSSPLYTVRRM
jgi:hypothetical protein